MSLRYRDPYRPIHEVWAIGTWIASAVVICLMSARSALSSRVLLAFVALCVVMAAWRAAMAAFLWRRKQALAGIGLTFMELHDLIERTKSHPDKVWLGRGFGWGQAQAQLMTEIVRADPSRLAPVKGNVMGHSWIHGISMVEDDVFIPLDHLNGHTLVVGTTRAGKTRLLDSLIAQAIARGEPVVIIDPKGDPDLRAAAESTCRALGRGEDFLYFHPAFPELSVRLDPMRNFARATELASRVASLLPAATGGDPFVAFSQMALNNIVQGLLLTGEKPSLVTLRRFIEGGPGGLVVKACKAYFAMKIPDYESMFAAYVKKSKAPSQDDLAAALIQFYRDKCQPFPHLASSELEGLFSSYEHEKNHFAKMVTSLMPILNMLTSGALGKLLSPDHTDMADKRPITDFKRVIRNRQVLYVGLDSLSDVLVGSAIGALMLADLTAVAGDRYNYGGDGLEAVNIFADEAAELVNDPFIASLNKGGGAKLRFVIATQTFADFAARMGTPHKAKMILGNLNNVIALRTIDADTQDYIASGLLKTRVRRIQTGQSNSANSENPLVFSGSATDTLVEEEVDLVPPALLGCLQNLHFFARISGGHTYKLRTEILKKPSSVAVD